MSLPKTEPDTLSCSLSWIIPICLQAGAPITCRPTRLERCRPGCWSLRRLTRQALLWMRSRRPPPLGRPCATERPCASTGRGPDACGHSRDYLGRRGLQWRPSGRPALENPAAGAWQQSRARVADRRLGSALAAILDKHPQRHADCRRHALPRHTRRTSLGEGGSVQRIEVGACFSECAGHRRGQFLAAPHL